MPQDLIAVSISHHRAPVEVRERLELSTEETRRLLEELSLEEALVLSTCNRTEIYVRPTSSSPGPMLIEKLLSIKKIEADGSYHSYFETLEASSAIHHLFRVITGIDSQVLGDQQIFAQVKEAFRISAEAGTTGSFLQKLSQAAFRVAKRVISETALTEGAATISYAAVELTRKIYDDIRARNILVIGAGETGELAAKHFLERGAANITIANRSLENADTMIARLTLNHANGNFHTISLGALEDVLPNTDIIISATSAPDYVLTEPVMKAALAKRQSSAPVVMIDIAVPRDIDPAIATLPNVFLKDIDDLRTIIDRNAERRRQEVPKAEAIISEELARFLESLSHLEAGPTIKELREKFEAIRQEELSRQRAKLDEHAFGLVDDMTRRIMNRLLHEPTVSLKDTNGEAGEHLTQIEIARRLFGLDKHND